MNDAERFQWLNETKPFLVQPMDSRNPATRASDNDREFFVAHPGLNIRHRPPVPAEFDGQGIDNDDILFVIVEQIGEGARLRHPIFRTNTP